jgi:hypothetical protein
MSTWLNRRPSPASLWRSRSSRRRSRRFFAAPLVLVACIAALIGCSHGDEGSPPELRRSGMDVTREPPPQLRRVCRRVAERLTDLPCPSLVPKTGVTADPNLSTLFVWPDGDLRMLTVNNGELDAAHVHWLVARGTTAAVERAFLSDEENEVKGVPRFVGDRLVRGREVRVYRYPSPPAGGFNGGHIAAVVPCGPTTIVASVHGYRNLYAAAAVAAGLADDAGC